MMYISRTLKKLTILLLLFSATFSCKKQKPTEDPPPPEPTPSIYESILTSHIFSFCGSAFTSTLKTKDGTDIGTVTVGNDAAYLYLTYTLTGNWYLGDVHSYAGRELLIPKNVDGNPVYQQFPGKQSLNFCDLRQSFTFRVLLSNLAQDNDGQCASNERYYIAMRASVRNFSDPANCVAGTDQPAWGAPFLINPGNADEWATAFYYCKEKCTDFCAYSQGFWFKNSSPNSSWCQNVKFGNLEITEQQGDSLWPPQNNWVKRALFQGSALQLSKYCYNNGNPIPASIINDYNRVNSFLSVLTYADIQNETYPASIDTTGVRQASGNIGRWICNNHCTTNPDPTACSGY
jgi:hypothetical protein